MVSSVSQPVAQSGTRGTGHLIDLYAAADSRNGDLLHGRPVRFRCSNSVPPRLLAGKPYASSESFTWLGEHFQTSLPRSKRLRICCFWAASIICFSTAFPIHRRTPWPGWQFYAWSTWPQWRLVRDIAYTAYVTCCQSILIQCRTTGAALLAGGGLMA